MLNVFVFYDNDSMFQSVWHIIMILLLYWYTNDHDDLVVTQWDLSVSFMESHDLAPGVIKPGWKIPLDTHLAGSWGYFPARHVWLITDFGIWHF
jgi:hypothetical protein